MSRGGPDAAGLAALQGRKVVVCVAGGIAAYKVVQVVRDLADAGADVRVVMTPSARHFVGEQTFATLSGNRVLSDVFTATGEVGHVEVARGADLVVIAPATAHTIAAMAHGLAGNAVTATILASRCSTIAVPAMHTEMWEHPATQANIAILQGRGVEILGPVAGALSSGDVGLGRMVEPEEIVAAIGRSLARVQTLSGKNFLVTAGGTQEAIDPVRFIGNRSSGLMGHSIAEEAAARGAKVTLVAGPTNLAPPRGVDVVRVRTAEEMRSEVLARAADADVIVKAAAVADWRPAEAAGRKLKKAQGPPSVELVPTPDILAELGSNPALRRPGGVVVGFAAETETDPGRLAELADLKRRQKGADLLVANDVASADSGFEVRTNRAVIASEEGTTDLGLVTKRALAHALVDRIALLLRV